jgi:CRP-like cAMP-binding protein
MAPTSNKIHNKILAGLSPDDFAALQPYLEPVALPKGKTFENANKPIENICFPESGMLSVVGGAKSVREVEVGIIGFEGMSGLPVIYGDHRSPHQTFVQVPGTGWRLPVAALRDAIGRSATLQQRLLRYAQAFMIQTTHTAIANAKGLLEERLARWILMAQDRARDDEVPLTHEFLSMMLAVRRPGVTEALHGLTEKGLLSQARGKIVVIDRDGLMERANGFYGVPEAEYERLLGASDLIAPQKNRSESGQVSPVRFASVPKIARCPNAG